MSESLRDQLSANLDKIVTREETPEVVEAPATTPSGGTEVKAPESKIAAAVATEKARDPDTGQFVKAEKKDEKDTAAAPAKGPTTPPPAQAAKPAAAAVQRPSSWKKDYWPHWDKLTGGQPLTPEEASALATYMGERETQFQHGVSTYKTEWDRAKPLMEAMAPYLPLLEQHGIQPTQWISNLGAAHRELALGSPQQKLARFQWLAQQYGVPIQAFTDETVKAQYLQSAPQPQQSSGLSMEQARALFAQEFAAQTSAQDVSRFIAERKEKQPYIEDPAFRETMAQLLESGRAQDLQSAHDAAIRLPQHSAIWESVQEQDRTREAEEKAKLEAERLAKAKGKAVSVRTATPSVPAGEKPKDRRSTLEQAFDEHMGGARV